MENGDLKCELPSALKTDDKITTTDKE